MPAVSPTPIVDPDTVIGRGGFGTVYAHPEDNEKCIKVLKSPLNEASSQHLQRLIDVVRWARPSDVDTLTTRFGWPVEAFGEPTAIRGFTMQRAPEACFFDLKILGRTARETLSAKHFMYEKYWAGVSVQTKEPEASVEKRIEILLDLASALDVLHENGLTYGDLSSNNVAINSLGPSHVFLFDADSILTASERAKSPIRTPEWETPEGLDQIQIDRSRFALFALRLFVKKPAIRPMSGYEYELPEQLHSLEPLIADLYSGGDAKSFDFLCDALRHRRSREAGSKAFQNAVASGFARRILREKSHATTQNELLQVQLAERQMFYEVAYVSMSGKQRRQSARRDELNRAGFQLDVPPIASLSTPPRTEEELKSLVHLAMFEELAGHLVAEGLGKLEDHGWLERAVQHALVETSGPELLAKPQRGALSAQTWWPATQFVNYMQLNITYPGGTQTVEMRRGDASERFERQLQIDHGGAVKLDLFFGALSPSGSVVWHPEPLSQLHDIEPAFDPPYIPTPNLPSDAGLTAELLDPRAIREQQIVERIKREKLAKAKRKKALLNLAASLTSIAILVFAVVPAVRSMLPNSPAQEETLQSIIGNAVNTASSTTTVQAVETVDPITGTPQMLRSNIDVALEYQVESNLMIATLLHNENDTSQYQLTWEETTSPQAIQQTAVLIPKETGTFSPSLTHINNDVATNLDCGGSITISDRQADPSQIGFSGRTRVGFDDQGIFLRIREPQQETSEVLIGIRRAGSAVTKIYRVEWQPEIRIPVESPGTWEIRLETDTGAIWLPPVTLSSSHPSFFQTQSSEESS